MKIKVLPLLLVAPLLTSCGNNVKAPKFVKEGDKIDATALNDKVNEIAKANPLILVGDEKFPSFVANRASSSSMDETIERGGKVIHESSNYSESKIKYEYDQSKPMIQSSSKSKSSASLKSKDDVTSTTKTNSKYTTARQVYTDGEDKHVITVDVNEKEYSSYLKISESSSAEDIINGYITLSVSDFTTFGLVAGLLPLMPEDQQKYYTCYANEGKKAYTVVYEKEFDKVEDKTDDVLNYTQEHKTSNKYQLILGKDDSFKVLIYEEDSYTETYARDFKNTAHSTYSQFAKGDVWKKVTKRAYTYEMSKKDVSLKEIDISSFAKTGSW